MTVNLRRQMLFRVFGPVHVDKASRAPVCNDGVKGEGWHPSLNQMVCLTLCLCARVSVSVCTRTKNLVTWRARTCIQVAETRKCEAWESAPERRRGHHLAVVDSGHLHRGELALEVGRVCRESSGTAWSQGGAHLATAECVEVEVGEEGVFKHRRAHQTTAWVALEEAVEEVAGMDRDRWRDLEGRVKDALVQTLAVARVPWGEACEELKE